MRNIQLRLIISVFFVTFFSSIIAFAGQKVIIYGDDSYPPYSFMETKEKTAKGIYVEILKKAFSYMPDYDVVITVIPWKRGIKNIKVGDGVALFPPYFAEKRVPWMNFSEPILAEKIIVFSTEEILKGKKRWPDDFFGLRGGINLGFNHVSMGGQAFADAVKEGKIKLDEAKSNDASLKKLSIGRIDFYLNDQLIDISNYPKVVRSSIVASQNHGYLGFTRKIDKFPFIPEFKKQFDEVIKKMKSNGEIDQIVQSLKK